MVSYLVSEEEAPITNMMRILDTHAIGRPLLRKSRMPHTACMLRVAGHVFHKIRLGKYQADLKRLCRIRDNDKG